MEPLNMKLIAELIKKADDNWGLKKDGKINNDESMAVSMFDALVEIEKAGGTMNDTTYEMAKNLVKTNAIFGLDLSSELNSSDKVEEKSSDNKSKSKTAEEKFNARLEELANISQSELEKTTLFKYTDSSNFKEHATLTSDKVTMFDILKEDYLNLDLAQDKDWVLTNRIKEKYPNKSEEEISSLVNDEKAKRLARFNLNSEGKIESYNLQDLAKAIITDRGTIGGDFTLSQTKQKGVGREHANVLSEFDNEVGIKDRDASYAELGIHHALEGDDNKVYQRKDRKVAETIVTFLGGTVEKYSFKERIFGKSEAKDNSAGQAVGNALTQAANPAAYLIQIQNQRVTVTKGAYNILNQQRQIAPIGPLNALIALATSYTVGEIQAAIQNYYGELTNEDAEVQLDPLKGPNYEKERTNIEAYMARVDSDSGKKFKPATKEALKELAQMFVYQHCTGEKDDNGAWIYETRFDYEEMYSFLREIAGNDTLNMEEFAKRYITENGQKILQQHIDRMNRNAEERNAKCNCPDVVQNNELIENKTDDTTQTNSTENQNTNSQPILFKRQRKIDCNIVDGSHSSWTRLSESYDCLRNSLKVKIMRDARTGRSFSVPERIMKMVQCITDGIYDKQRIDELLDIVTKAKNRNEFERMLAEKSIGFDYDAYIDLLVDHPLPSRTVIMPDKLYDCDYKVINLRVKVKDKGNIAARNDVIGCENRVFEFSDDDQKTWRTTDSSTYASDTIRTEVSWQ